MNAETLEIPAAMRKAVAERDQGYCRMCGKYIAERGSIHHIRFGGDRQGMGGRRDHSLENLVTLCWLPGDNDCHQRAHANKLYWQPLLGRVVVMQSRCTALALVRLLKRRGAVT